MDRKTLERNAGPAVQRAWTTGRRLLVLAKLVAAIVAIVAILAAVVVPLFTKETTTVCKNEVRAMLAELATKQRHDAELIPRAARDLARRH